LELGSKKPKGINKLTPGVATTTTPPKTKLFCKTTTKKKRKKKNKKKKKTSFLSLQKAFFPLGLNSWNLT
jgi:hypothetical protein